MDKRAIIYLVRLAIQKILGVVCYLVGSSWVLNQRSSIYFSIYITGSLVLGLSMFMINSKTLAERNKINTNSPKWDKILLGVFWLLEFFVIYFFAGYEANKLTENVDFIYWIGIILNILSGVITLRAMIVNTFLESTARIQHDREQTVCEDGPYRVVRHPTYLSIMISSVGIYMVFPTPRVIVCTIIIAVIIIFRTYLEDKMLQNELKGYKEYTKKVKYRLIPFIW
jgi:protein-S-isoprenylcysteine O-methyltransferase Ste14